MKKYIVCCGTSGRCVVIGESEAEPVQGEPCRLTNARMVLYWDEECGGLFGVAASGPKGETRITHAIETTVTSPVTEWLTVSEEAAQGIDSWPAC